MDERALQESLRSNAQEKPGAASSNIMLREWWLAPLTLVGCYFGAKADTVLQFPEVGAAVIFPPYAVLTTALLVSSPRQWWIYLLLSSLGSLLPHLDAGASLSFVLAAEGANYARALVVAILLSRFVNPPKSFQTLRKMSLFLLFSVGAGPAAAACLGATVVVVHDPSQSFWLAWQEWFLSNAVTGLSLLPIFLVAAQGSARPPLTPSRLLEASVLTVGMAGSAYVFAGADAYAGNFAALLYWPLPFLLWTAVRFGSGGISFALLGVSALTIWDALHGRGPFLHHSPTVNLLHLQLFMIGMSVPVLLVHALVEERRSAAAALRAADAKRRQLEVQNEEGEQLRESSRRKDEFLAVLGHELRSPLAPMSSALEVMRRDPSSAVSSRRAQDVMGRQLRHMTHLVNDLMDVAAIARGEIRLEVESVDLKSVVADAVETTRALMDARRHVMTVSLPDPAPRLRGDAVRLTQVATNLLSNAAKYTPPGGRIELSVISDRQTWVLSVRDNGVGIAPEMLKPIFEAFTQVPGSRDSSQRGIGIGLMLVKRLTELHGGEVEARSPGLGGGSEFIVRLPATER
jgi:signal transduction histidine kinase